MSARHHVERFSAALRLERRADDRLVAGVASAAAARIGVDPYLVRLYAVVASFAGGVGVIGYLGLWALSTPATATSTGSDPPASVDSRRTVAAGFVGAGVLVLARAVGLWPGDALMVPAVAIALGAAVSSSRVEPERLFRGRVTALRVLAGIAIAAVGVVALATRGGSIDDVRQSAVTVVLALAGLVVVIGPWLGRVVHDLDDERRERVRGEERAALATHLHDSVLQTLALIQRSADDPRRTVTLARRQERELRSWLYGSGHEPPVAASLHRAVEEMAQEIEDAYDVRVDAVVVGDRPLDDTAAALLGAVREALVNAARHAGTDEVAVYVEVEPHHLSAYVRDRGCGFDPGTVSPTRRGIADSIRARIERAGGTARIRSAPETGTEVDLAVPVP